MSPQTEVSQIRPRPGATHSISLRLARGNSRDRSATGVDQATTTRERPGTGPSRSLKPFSRTRALRSRARAFNFSSFPASCGRAASGSGLNRAARPIHRSLSSAALAAVGRSDDGRVHRPTPAERARLSWWQLGWRRSRIPRTPTPCRWIGCGLAHLKRRRPGWWNGISAITGCLSRCDERLAQSVRRLRRLIHPVREDRATCVSLRAGDRR